MALRAYIFLSITALSWGANAVAGRLAAGEVSPMVLTFLRWSMALGILLVFALPRIRRDWAVIRANIWLLCGYGALGFTCFNITLYTALNYTTAINVVIEQAGMPMLIFLANFILFRIAVTKGQIFGFLLTLTGVLITASGGDFYRLIALELNFGDALMLLAVVLYGGYTVALRFKPEMHWLSLMTVMAAAAFMTSIPFAAWEQMSGNAIWPGGFGLAIAAFTAIFPSIVAQVFYIKGNELIGSNRAGLFINLVPIFGTILSIVILGETFHLYHVIALALVLGGIWLAERRQNAAPATAGSPGG